MLKKTAPWLRALFVVTALLLSQVQAVVASDIPAPTVQESRSAALDPEETALGLALPGAARDDCKIYINTFLLQEPFTGPPVAGLPNYGAVVENTTTDDPPLNPLVKKKSGDQTDWLVVIENATNDGGCGPAGEEELTEIQAELFIYEAPPGTQTFATLAVPLSTTTLTHDGDLSWGIVPFTIPANVNGDISVHTTAATEAVDHKAAGVAPNDVVDFDDDRMDIQGPGFNIESFEPNLPAPAQAAPGELVDFTLIITNTRGGSTITGISIDSPYAQFEASCTAYPFPGGGGWTPVGGGTPITALATGEFAQCIIQDVPIPTGSPTFVLIGDVTATDGAPAFDLTQSATSGPVDVKMPSVGITKTVQSVRRGSVTIYPSDPPLTPATTGDVITYEIIVTNTGDINISNIWVVDSLTGPIYIAPTVTLLPAETLTVTATHVVQQDSPDPLVNNVSVTARGGGVDVTAEASAGYDIQNSMLDLQLFAENPATGDPIFSVLPGDQVLYRMVLTNKGTTTLNNLTYVTLSSPLQTVGTPPALIPNSLPGTGALTLTWTYTIQATDPDPLISTVRVRGASEGGQLLYGQDQAALDIANPAIDLNVIVLEPESPSVLRGGTVLYRITITNKDAINPLCDVVVDQFRRDPDTGIEQLIISNVPLDWPTAAGQLNGAESATGYTSYLVTGADKDPLDMIFEVRATANCVAGNDITDRTTRTLDISDAQINSEIIAGLGDGLAEIGETVVFTYLAQNVGSVTLEDLSATWCIIHGTEATDFCDLPFDADKSLSPRSIGSFEDTSGGFTYTFLPVDADALPFIVEVTMTGTDSDGNVVSIKTAINVPIATDKILLEAVGPEQAVIGDTESFGFSITNNSGVELRNVRIYNMLEPAIEVGFFDSIPFETGSNVQTGQFLYAIAPDQGIVGDVLTMPIRLVADTFPDIGELVANDVVTVALIPILLVEKIGDTIAVAGEAVHYSITITNQSHSQTVTVTDYSDSVFDQYSVPYANANFGPWPSGEGVLPFGSTISGNFTIPKPPGVDALPDPLVNVFTITGTRSYDNATVTGTDDHSVDISCPIAFNFQVRNLDDDPDDVLGEWLEWQISFTNMSGDTLENIVISDTLEYADIIPTGTIIWPVSQGTLAPGQTAVIPPFQKQILNFYYIGEGSAMKDLLTASFSSPAGSSSCATEFAYLIYSPIGVIKLPNPWIAFTGETVDYHIYLYNVCEDNDGIFSRYYVTTTDSLLEPKPMPFAYNQPESTDETTSGWMDPGESIEKHVFREVLPDDPEQLINLIIAEFPDPSDENFTLWTWWEALVFTGNPLQLTKTPSSDLAAPGTPITYDYTVTNVSPYIVTDIHMVDTLIGDLVPGLTGGLINLDPGMAFTDLVDVPYDIPLDAADPLTNTVTATGTVHLPDLSTRDITNSLTVQVDLQDIEIEIIKTAFTDNAGVPGSALEDNFPASGPDGMPEAETGTMVHYCFDVINSGGDATYIDNITIEDALFPGVLQGPFQTAVLALGHPSGDPDRVYGQQSVHFCYGPIPISRAMGDPLTNLVRLNGISSGGGYSVYTFDELSIDILGTDLLVTKMPSQPLAFVGEEISYTITIQNNNENLNIVDLLVTDMFEGSAPIPLPLELFDWTQSGITGSPIGILGPQGGRATYTYPYVVKTTDPDPLSNFTTGTGKLQDGSLPEDQWVVVEDSTRATVAITASQLVVRKTARPNVSRPSVVDCGTGENPPCETVAYTISITNVGSTAVSDIIAVDEHFDPTTGTVMTELFENEDLTDDNLSPFETAFIYYNLPMPTTAQLVANPQLDPFINTVTIYGVVLDDNGLPIPMRDPDPTDPYDDDKSIKTFATESVDILQPNLRIAKSAMTLAAAPGQTVSYNITLTNVGDQRIDELVFNDIVEAQSIDLDAVCPSADLAVCPFLYGPEPFDDWDNDPGTPDTANPKDGDPYDEALGLMPKEQLRATITVQVPEEWAENEFTNVAEIRGRTGPDTPTDVQDRASATIDIRSDGIEVEKIASLAAAPVGTPITYTVNVTNIGGTALQYLILADPAFDADPDKSIRFDNGFPDSPEAEIAGDDSETLDPGEMFTYQYVHTLLDTDADPYINIVTVAGYTVNSSVLNVAQAAVDVQGATLEVEKLVCLGLDGDNDPATQPAPCVTVVNFNDAVADDVTYYLHIFNTGGVPVQNINVIDSVGTVPAIDWPEPNNGLAPDDGAAGGNDEIWVMYPYTVTIGDPDPLENLVTVTGQSPSGAGVEASDTAALSLVTSDLNLTKTAVAQAIVGQTVTYNLMVENLGTTEITNVEVVDPLSPQGSAPVTGCSIASLGAGATQSCSFTHVVALGDPSPLVNTATATGTQSGVPVSDTATHMLDIVVNGLTVTKTANPTFVQVGDQVTYTYQITNSGTAGVSSLAVDDSEPGTEAFLPSAWPNFLAPGQSETRTWTRTMTALDPDPYTNTVTVSGVIGGQPVIVTATETVSISNSALVVSIVPDRTFVVAGEDVIFAYTVTNMGTSAMSALTLDGIPCGAAVLNPQLTSTDLPAGTSQTVFCTVTAALPGPVQATFSAQATIEAETFFDSATVEVPVTAGGVLVVKTADVAAVLPTPPDNVIHYTITVTNVGTETLDTFDVDDPMIVGLSPAPPSSLPMGQSFIMTGTYTVPTVNPPGSVANTVTVTAEGATTGNPYTDTDSVSVAVLEDPNADLILTKEVYPQLVFPGQTVTYTFTVRNISGSPAANITVSDPGLAVTDPPSGVITVPNLGIGGQHSFSRTITVPAAYTGSTFENTATVLLNGVLQDNATAVAIVGQPGLEIENIQVSQLNDGISVPYPQTGVPAQVTFTLSNTGGAAVTGLSYTASVNVNTSTACTGPALPASLAPVGQTGDSVTVTCEFTAPVALAEYATGLSRIVTIDASGTTGGIPVTDNDTAPVTLVDLLLDTTVTVNPTAGAPGDDVTFTATLTNNGYSPLGCGSGVNATYSCHLDVISFMDQDDTDYTSLFNGWAATLGNTVLTHGQTATFTTAAFEIPVVASDRTYTMNAAGSYHTAGLTSTQIDAYAVSDTGSVTLTIDLSTGDLEIENIVVSHSGGETILPPQTGEQVQVAFTLHNVGTQVIQTPGYTATLNIIPDPVGNPGVLLPCTNSGAALPASLAAGASVNLTCTFTAPIALADYAATAGGLSRVVTINATGTAGGTVTDQATAPVTLIDLRLGVALTVNPTTAEIGDTVTFTATITNNGYSPLGCDAAVDAAFDCHLRVTSFRDQENIDPATLLALFNGNWTSPTVPMVLGNIVLTHGQTATFITSNYTIPTVTSNRTYTLVMDGGYYATGWNEPQVALYPALPPNFGTAVLTIDLPDVPEIEVTLAYAPNPPTYGAAITYTITVTNTGNLPVENLTATYQINPIAAQPASTDGIMLVSAGQRPAMQTSGTITLNATTLAPNTSTTGFLAKTEDQQRAYLFRVTVAGRAVQSTVQATDVAEATITPGGVQTPTVTGTLSGTLDPNAIDPIVAKTPSITAGQVGAAVAWSITVRNGGTAAMSNITIQDSVPTTLDVGTATTSRGTVVVAGQLVTITTGTVSPGETITVTVNTTINSTAAAPTEITNTACAARDGGAQKCATGTVSLGPGTAGETTLPSTGIRSKSSSSLPVNPAGFLGLFMVGALMILMTAQPSSRRMIFGLLALVIVIVVVVGAAVTLFLGGDDEEKKTATDEAVTSATETPGGATPGETQVVVEPTGIGTTPVGSPEPVVSPGAVVMDFPPTPTPYIIPTPGGVRYLMIPKLAAQFSAPIPIVEMPLIDQQWDVSGLGYYVGWLEGTTWMDPAWGNTVLAAHVQLGTNNPGPFWGLGELLPGDEIIVTEGDVERKFVVMSSQKVDPGDWTVTAPTSGPTLTLITCTEWDNSYGVFSQRMVIRAVPAS